MCSVFGGAAPPGFCPASSHFLFQKVFSVKISEMINYAAQFLKNFNLQLARVYLKLELTLNTCDSAAKRENNAFPRYIELLTPQTFDPSNFPKTKVVHICKVHKFVSQSFPRTLFFGEWGEVKNHQKSRFSIFFDIFISDFRFSLGHQNKRWEASYTNNFCQKRFS